MMAVGGVELRNLTDFWALRETWCVGAAVQGAPCLIGMVRDYC